jgi:hypothetical protein
LDCYSPSKEIRYPHGQEAISVAMTGDTQSANSVTLDMHLSHLDNPNNIEELIKDAVSRVAMPIAYSIQPNADSKLIRSACVEPLMEQLSFEPAQAGGSRVREFYQKLEDIQTCVCQLL